VVVGDKGAGGAGLSGGLVVPDGGGEREESLQDACGDAAAGAACVAFEAELGFEGLVDRFDDLAQRPQEPLGGPGLFGFGGGSDEGDARGVEGGLIWRVGCCGGWDLGFHVGDMSLTGRGCGCGAG